MNINILRYSLFGIAGGTQDTVFILYCAQEVDRVDRNFS